MLIIIQKFIIKIKQNGKQQEDIVKKEIGNLLYGLKMSWGYEMNLKAYSKLL